MKSEKKIRLSKKFNFVWRNKDGMIHFCYYLTCDDGCDCEKGARMSLECLNDLVKKANQKWGKHA